jgi:23S rRNA pseudouridine1911/1915/1917 synthase
VVARAGAGARPDVTGAGRVVVPDPWSGERLDRALAAHLDLPRSRVAAWIRAGRVSIGGRAVEKPGTTLRTGELLAWDPPPAIDERVEPEPGALTLLHEDADVLAIDKPPGLVVHPGAGRRSGTLVHRLLAAYPELAGVGGAGRPGVVHRLDAGTSGVLLVARTAAAHARLARAFAGRAVDKRYLAIVWGDPKGAAGVIEAPIGRHPRERQRMAVVAAGRPARTGWRRLAGRGPIALVEFTLHTGRTHQIRVHARHFGHPLVGDPVYGEARWRGLPAARARPLAAFGRPALHAWRIGFAHPATGERLEVEAPVPDDLADLWRAVTGEEIVAHLPGK